jgi:hypothetical protein
LWHLNCTPFLLLSFLPQTWCNELNAAQPLNRGLLYSTTAQVAVTSLLDAIPTQHPNLSSRIPPLLHHLGSPGHGLSNWASLTLTCPLSAPSAQTPPTSLPATFPLQYWCNILLIIRAGGGWCVLLIPHPDFLSWEKPAWCWLRFKEPP